MTGSVSIPVTAVHGERYTVTIDDGNGQLTTLTVNVDLQQENSVTRYLIEGNFNLEFFENLI